MRSRRSYPYPTEFLTTVMVDEASERPDQQVEPASTKTNIAC